MKVDVRAYAYWSPSGEGGAGFRYGTLLVGGGDGRLVGNVVMKNPGSARPLHVSSLRPDGRLEFSVDATMHAVAELFGIDRGGGAVRIYNLSDVREADFVKARKLFGEAPVEADAAGIGESGVPTYLGWGDMYRDARFAARARSIFDAVRATTPCYDPVMESNPFFHPLYLMRYGRNLPECVSLRGAFSSLLEVRSGCCEPTLFGL